jgi:hypothetical protein
MLAIMAFSEMTAKKDAPDKCQVVFVFQFCIVGGK